MTGQGGDVDYTIWYVPENNEPFALYMTKEFSYPAPDPEVYAASGPYHYRMKVVCPGSQVECVATFGKIVKVKVTGDFNKYQ